MTADATHFLARLVRTGPDAWTNKLLSPRRSDGTLIQPEDRSTTHDIAQNGLFITRRSPGEYSLVALMKTKHGVGPRLAITFDCDANVADNLGGDIYVDKASDAMGVNGIDFAYDAEHEMIRYTAAPTSRDEVCWNYDHWFRLCCVMLRLCASTTPANIEWDDMWPETFRGPAAIAKTPQEPVAPSDALEKSINIIEHFVTNNLPCCEHFMVFRPRRCDGSVLENLQDRADVAKAGLVFEKFSTGAKISFIASDNGVVDLIAQFELGETDGDWMINGGEFFVADISRVTGTAGVDYQVSDRKNGFYYCAHAYMAHNRSSTLDVLHWAEAASQVMVDCITTLPRDPIPWDSTGFADSVDTPDPKPIYDLLDISASLDSDGYMFSPLKVRIEAEKMETARLASEKAANELLMQENREASQKLAKKTKKSKKNAKNKARQKDKALIKRLTEELLSLELTTKCVVVEASSTRVAYNPMTMSRTTPPLVEEIATEITEEDENGDVVYEDEESDSECDICMERPRTAIAFPCKHANMCSTCVRACINAKKFDCPKCRCALEGWWLQDEGVTVECFVA